MHFACIQMAEVREVRKRKYLSPRKGSYALLTRERGKGRTRKKSTAQPACCAELYTNGRMDGSVRKRLPFQSQLCVEITTGPISHLS